MKAAFYRRQGPASDVLEVGEQPVPTPGPGEVRVRLRTSGVNPSDWKVRKGGIRGMAAPLIIPHSDGAGDIDAVGPGVDAERIGQRVWIWSGQWKRAFGTAAQYIALPSQQAVRMPDSLDYFEGACLGVPALTALNAVMAAGVGPGRFLLVPGGAGAVGHYAIQMAKAQGAIVLTTVSGDAKAAHARAAGADHVINYRTSDVGAEVMAVTQGRGVDAVVEMDLSANASAYPGVLRAHAQIVVYGMSSQVTTLPTQWLMQNSVTLQFAYIHEIGEIRRRAVLSQLRQWLEEGRLKHTVGVRLPLPEVARAHDLVESGTVMGKVILEID